MGAEMIDILFTIAGIALGALVSANLALGVARVLHRDRIARKIQKASSHVTWLFKLGDDGENHRPRGWDDRLRA